MFIGNRDDLLATKLSELVAKADELKVNKWEDILLYITPGDLERPPIANLKHELQEILKLYLQASTVLVETYQFIEHNYDQEEKK